MGLDLGGHPAGTRAAPPAGRGVDLVETMGSIRRSAAAVDQLWGEVRDDGSPTLGLALGEASQALHRALMALSGQSSGRPVELKVDVSRPDVDDDDLHGRIIEGLFQAGIDIQSVMGKTDGYVAGRLAGAVDRIDQVIKAIRAAAFDRVAPVRFDPDLRTAAELAESGRADPGDGGPDPEAA